MKLTLQNKNIIIQFPYDKEIIKAVKTIPNRRFNFKNKFWIIPDGQAEQALEILKPFDFEIDPAIRKELASRKADETALEKIKTSKDIKIETLNPLFPYQNVGVAFMLKAKNCLNADEVGLGKSLQSITACQIRGDKKNLIVAPKILLDNWKNEIEKWYPEATPIIVDGSKEKRYKIYIDTKKRTGIWFLIVGYETMRNDLDKINEIC